MPAAATTIRGRRTRLCGAYRGAVRCPAVAARAGPGDDRSVSHPALQDGAVRGDQAATVASTGSGSGAAVACGVSAEITAATAAAPAAARNTTT